MLKLEDFTNDKPWEERVTPFAPVHLEDLIDGVQILRLTAESDSRGSLTVLMSNRADASAITPHVYLVEAEPGSVRAWVYHRRQSDRLAFTNGDFRVVLYDLRPDSPTYRRLNVMDVGEKNKVQLTIAPFVVHGVHNQGKEKAFFINMPTHAYDPAKPDKARLPANHPGIPYSFD
jgi:dTDP-4-dehydrorhamnose 3,5-epimerase